MKKTKAFCLAVLFIIAATITYASARTDGDPSADEPVITIEGKTVTYVGKISEKSTEYLLDAVEGREIETLVISSGGGEINAGMKMGFWVFDNNIDVEVDEVCMSSCANYVFTAGRRKSIRNGSIVAWHGSALQEFGMSDKDVRESVTETFNSLPESERKKQNLDDQIRRSIEQLREYRITSIKRQADFFKKIGVDEYICRIGNEKYEARDFFVLSVKDMGRFGIDNVRADRGIIKSSV